ncbi:MAG: hypothetical protein NC933_03080 [Candidatus Omnitrophica bacterium]|nr:hypothetical protein [Candidatus Omnitrophota bacterium]
MQIIQDGRAFLVNPDGKIVRLKDNAMDYIMKSTSGRVKVFVQSRVNDMTKLGATPVKDAAMSPREIDNGVFALALAQMKDLDDIKTGRNAILEQVGQDAKVPIKGAQPVRTNNKEFLIETLAQSKHVSGVINNLGSPLNRFFITYKAAIWPEIKRQGLPVYFRFRDGYLYPETVTGDVTMLQGINAGWAMEDSRRIFDYKDSKTLPNGLAAALSQDNDSRFLAFLEKLQAGKKKVTLADVNKAPGLGEKKPKAVGAIRASGSALTAAEHGTRGVRATVLPNENTVNGAIASRIAVPGGAYALFYVKQPDFSSPDEIQLGTMSSQTKDLNDLQLVNLSALMREGPKTGIGLVVVKGLKDELRLRTVATDLIFHPGYTRGVAYVDESDLFYLLSLDNGVELILSALKHEKAHIDKPGLSEAEIEAIAPTYDLRKALLMRDGMTSLEANLRLAIDGDEKAYNAIVAMPKDKVVEYFESGLQDTMKNLPEDIFGFGNGYDVRGNAQPIKGGVVDLTPANLYLVGKLMGTHHAKPGDKVLLTGDIRLHTPILRYCMALGIASTGVDVEYAPDFLTTGAHNLLATENSGGYKFMVQVSGSHGPSQKNGFKIKADLGNNILEPLYAEKLEELYRAKNKVRTGAKLANIKEISGLETVVVNTLDETLPSITKDELVVIDPRAGAAGPIITSLLKKRGFEIIDMDKVVQKDLISEIKRLWDGGRHRIAVLINMSPDGTMSRGIWDPSLPEALEPTQKLVNLINARIAPDMPKAIGAVFDGDADRISAILEDGRAVPAFEMTLPYYQRFLIDKDNQEVIEKIARSGGGPIKVVCDVRANSKLLTLIDRVNADLQKKTGIKDRNIVEGYFITTGYPPQLGFMQARIAELEKFVESTPSLVQDADFMKKFDHLKRTYFTAEASGHNFFHISKAYPSRVCDCAISGFVTLLNIRETIGSFEAPVLGLEKGKAAYELTDLFDNFPPAYSSREITVAIPNNIKIETAKKIGAWMKDHFKKDLKPYNEPIKEGDYLVQSKDDGFVTVSGFKVQLKDGRSALVRWSNTSEKLTTIFEGKNLTDLINITREVTERLRQEGTIDVAPLEKEIARLETLELAQKASPRPESLGAAAATTVVYEEETAEPLKETAPKLPDQFPSDRFEWIPGREGIFIRMKDNPDIVYSQITENGEWAILGSEEEVSPEVVEKTEPEKEEISKYPGISASTLGQASMLRTERELYIDKKYVAEDHAALEKTLMLMKFNKAIADNITVVLLYDTALEPDAQKAVQAGEVAIAKYLGNSVIEFRGRSAKLLDSAMTQIDDLKASGKKFAVVAITGEQTLSEIGKKLIPLVRDINARMAENEAVKLRHTKRPISAVIKIEDSRMSPIALYDIALKIGYNFGEEDIYMALSRVALNGLTNDTFKKSDLDELLKTGYISLKPIRPIDLNEAREAYEAQAAALRSM